MKARQPRSIVDFILDKRKANCPVCKLPQAVRGEMVAARRTGIVVSVVLEWLQSEHGVKITIEQFRRHASGMHDGREGVVGRGTVR